MPRATSALNALQRVGGSTGTALLAVVLQNEMRTGGSRASAFGHTFAWALGIGLVVIIPAAILVRAEQCGKPRRPRDVSRLQGAGPTPPS